MGQSIRWEVDLRYPCGVWLVQLYLIGQEQRDVLQQGVWNSADIGTDCFLILIRTIFSSIFHQYNIYIFHQAVISAL